MNDQAGSTELDGKPADLSWERLIGRDYHVVLPEKLWRLLREACVRWEAKPAGMFASALRSGLHRLADDHSYQDTDPQVEMFCQDRVEGVWPPEWASWLVDPDRDEPDRPCR